MQRNLSTFKTQLRTASQIFSQQQAKNDHQGNITRADIATLLRQTNTALAREKAERLLQDDLFSDLLGELDVHLGLITEHIQELAPDSSPSPTLVEAAATIIYATPFVHSKELDDIRNFLIHCLGPTFGRSAATNQDHYVSKRVLKLVPTRVPSAFELDIFLKSVAATHAVEWSPDPQRQDMVNALSELLDPNGSVSTIDLERLRQLCRRGLPDEPPFIRPRIWRILLGTLPPAKTQWTGEAAKQRDSYYDLARRLLNPFIDVPGPHTLQEDTLLLNVWKQLSSLPPRLFSLLEEASENEASNPLYESGVEGKASLAEILSLRLRLLHNDENRDISVSPTPEIRLEAEDAEDAQEEDDAPLKSSTSTTLVLPRSFLFAGAHPKHCQSLLRLLFLHSMINPGNLFAHAASVLVVVYSIMNREVDANDVPHIEADTFWLFAAVVAEFSPLEDDAGAAWFRKFEECVKWADFDLFVDLDKNGLSPSLPHYSYRWIMPVLTHTMPLSSVFVVWDTLFACGSRSRDEHPKLDRLMDVCTAMVLRKKMAIARLGYSNGQRLWSDDVAAHANGGFAMGSEGFAEGLRLLQQYDVGSAGGVDRILQTANDLAHRRAQEAAQNSRGALGIGARITGTVWKGLMSRSSSGQSTQSEDYDSSDSDTDATQAPEDHTITASSSLASKLTDAVWKGITNQSAMEVPDSPTMDSQEGASTTPVINVEKDLPSSPHDSNAGGSIWGYAERLRESDTVATLSRVGSTWRAKGILGSWGATSDDAPPPVPTKSPLSPPLRPFSPPTHSATSPEQETTPTSGFLSRTRSILSSSRSPPVTSAPKSPRAPRPLLLGSAPIVGTPSRESSPRSSLSTPDNPEWAEVMRMKKQHFHRDSYSSVSSLSPSDAYARVPKSARSDWESDGSSSRIVSLNRRSVSPMAPTFRAAGNRMMRPSSRNSSVSSTSPLNDSRSPTPSKLDGLPNLSAIALNALADSPLAARRPSVGRQPSEPLVQEPSDVSDNENRLSASVQSLSLSVTPNGSSTESGQPPAGASSSAYVGPTRASRVRTKRQMRPANLQIDADSADSSRVEKLRIQVQQKDSSPSSLGVEWPKDDGEMLATPKATSFEDEDQGSAPKSPSRRLRKSSGNERKGSADTINGNAVADRPRKVSSGARARKISAERNRRDSAAEEGDDEGYDDLLSAYESEEGHPVRNSLR